MRPVAGDFGSPYVVDRLTGRQVIVRDPDPKHPHAAEPFVAHETSVRMLNGRVLLHVLSQGGRSLVVPPNWISDCPCNVVPLAQSPD